MLQGIFGNASEIDAKELQKELNPAAGRRRGD